MRIEKGPRGWGKVAISNRMGKHPEPLFVKSLLRLCLAGLRPGDTVLDDWPVAEPHHVAANKLALWFLTKTDCDSLLFLDDDMSFSPFALEAMRANEENWIYDVAMGFCTFRTPPPHAVAYRLSDEQPGMPKALGGEMYNALAHLPESGAIEVDAVGLAFTLVRREVLESMVGEYGPEWTSWFDFGLHSEMEDIRFSKRVREHGFTMCVDTSAKIGHVGTYTYGWRDHQIFVEQLEN